MKIQYYDRAMTRYLTLDPDSGSAEEMQAPTATPDIDGLPAEKFHTDEDGRFEYYCAFRYTLRDDMERKIRRRFYRRDFRKIRSISWTAAPAELVTMPMVPGSFGRGFL